MNNFLVNGGSSGIGPGSDQTWRRFLTTLMVVLFTLPLLSQEAYRDFYSESLKINNTGMYMLGSWALLNITSGACGWSKYTGTTSYFHQMNLFWNLVNLSIAGFALYGNHATDYSAWGAERILDKHLKTQNLFLINGGLDVVYMGTGLLLRHLSGRYPNNADRLKGYGNSVILQGAFLFAFDLVMYGIQLGHRTDFLDQVALAPASGFPGITVRLTL